MAWEERDQGKETMDKFILCYHFIKYNWRASVASETLTGVTQLKIGDVCLFICLDVRKAFLYFDPRVFVLVRWSTPSQTSLNRILCLSISTRITLEIELFTVLNSFTGAVKT